MKRIPTRSPSGAPASTTSVSWESDWTRAPSRSSTGGADRLWQPRLSRPGQRFVRRSVLDGLRAVFSRLASTCCAHRRSTLRTGISDSVSSSARATGSVGRSAVTSPPASFTSAVWSSTISTASVATRIVFVRVSDPELLPLLQHYRRAGPRDEVTRSCARLAVQPTRSFRPDGPEGTGRGSPPAGTPRSASAEALGGARSTPDASDSFLRLADRSPGSSVTGPASAGWHSRSGKRASVRGCDFPDVLGEHLGPFLVWLREGGGAASLRCRSVVAGGALCTDRLVMSVGRGGRSSWNRHGMPSGQQAKSAPGAL